MTTTATRIGDDEALLIIETTPQTYDTTGNPYSLEYLNRPMTGAEMDRLIAVLAEIRSEMAPDGAPLTGAGRRINAYTNGEVACLISITVQS